MHTEKIGEAISSAINHLEKSIKALTNQDENAVRDPVWRAAAETEYALFLFSLVHQGESSSSSMKPLKQTEIGPAIDSAKGLLIEAKESMKAEKIEEAHEKTWNSRGYILKVWDQLEKKRKTMSKAAGATPPK